jgi:hypothetical protein
MESSKVESIYEKSVKSCVYINPVTNQIDLKYI